MDFERPNLTLVIDRRLYRSQDDREPLSLVEAAIDGGITMVQLRLAGDSERSDIEDLAAYAVALRLREMTAGRVPFMVTANIELAEKCNADGLMLIGERSYKPSAAKEYLRGRQGNLIGHFVDSVQSATRAENGGADFVQAGPIFGSANQEESLAMIRKVKDAINLPLVAFGGIDSPERATAAIKAGADGVAVTQAILSAADPRKAAEELRSALDDILHDVE